MPDAQRIDLKSLIRFIVDQKELATNLILDEGCVLHIDDPKPLIKVLNYFLNYLKQFSDHPLQIGLDLMPEYYLLSMLMYTQTNALPPIPESIAEVLQEYGARYELQNQEGSFVQIKVYFQRQMPAEKQ